MTYQPIYLELKSRRCLIVGGGEVAARRAINLLAHEADVVVVAPEIVESLRGLAAQSAITWNPCPYNSSFINGMTLAVAATNVPEVNDQVSIDARSAGILLCRADRSGEGDFIFPAVLERGSLTLSVATQGASPTLTAVLLEQLADQSGPEWSTIVELCKTIRDDTKTRSAGAEARKAAIRRILADEEIRKLLNDGKIQEAEARARECLLLS